MGGFLEDGLVAPQIIKGYRKAGALVQQKLQEMAVDLTQKSDEEKRSMLIKCAETTLTSKLVADYKQFFADMIVNVVSMLGEDLDVRALALKKVTGGSVLDSLLIDGVAFKKTFSYAGFEQQPKRFTQPKILLLNLELELKAEKENAEVRITDPDQYQSIVDAEWKIIYDKLDKCVQCGATIVLSRLPIGNLGTQYFADRGVFCAG